MDETRLSLLERVRQSGDHSAWAEFVRIYQPLLVRYTRKLNLPDHATEDVVQTILVNLWRSLPSFQLDRSRGRFRSWLYRVASNAVTDWRRVSRGRNEVHTGQEFPEVADTRADNPDEWERTCREHAFARAREAVRPEVNPTTWACFEQFLLHNRKASAVGAELDLSDAAVRQNARRVLQRVGELAREFLEEMDA